jgi:putative LysE/RhtB family amino acid efflux pump
MAPLAVGFGLGFAVAAQVGPVTLLTVRSVLRGGLAIGLAMAAGVATIDALYAAAGAAGAGAVLGLDGPRVALGLAGAAVLAAIGVRTLRPAVGPQAGDEGAGQPDTPARALRTALAATASNPLTIASWAAIFAAAATAELASDGASSAMMVAGVLAGSFAWMALLSGGLALARSHIGERGMRLIDLASGAGILVFAALLAWRTLAEG